MVYENAAWVSLTARGEQQCILFIYTEFGKLPHLTCFLKYSLVLERYMLILNLLHPTQMFKSCLIGQTGAFTAL